ncbi:acetyl-CoA carboxylase biotin carboxylase subunit [Rhizobium ruizarguesonis]|jgi:propionyl-CoA carboxylase alpha chain|uniref:acetyl-CoA carboxylase biotin carboxylase subunit n=1 Tax=Rhizobium ruizarguesonis TaxID=2081791 RepID=UPI00102FFC48|nr:acetyl/propionyl/methylcrotonyl-CoA carboxylase subunit alpha [Rhizobium ruizarguesonis]MBY5854753.1 acetyl/propionyl/methylcrotonyl-CoA carboxylase subunit alpha [Rhizobium leguminosarum]NKL43780.1 acetyl-CoA carboxylase biotin carboxylase subunit [Rhizobium leguminosarum bv. viciae]TAT88580.1 acetyl/propionyl/methylcrotonyl-CoA carboxylase subunit alpha [Rhizobium ruizarguesonis]TAY79381.1 acetyl/propionyl/methylcrotonyl-CoA carboxylase subunit alpha [Rhizobium ruizarguesonis]TAZ35050.1 a
MFKKILIANRGEIACRVIKTARRMGILTVSVYSDADRDALHVEMADEAVHIGPAAASESYLVAEKIIAACKATGAEAVHPGYGFLSERASFCAELEKQGIVFIGPKPKAIMAMGDKIESKKFANAAGVSTVPGHLGIIEDAAHAEVIAGGIGYPVMIKASAGGGGKGMRIAWNQAEVRDGFDRARSEAKSSFGDDRVFIEKYIVEPRHIEIQVLADAHGNVVYLGERECSIQRRNQKVAEEAPSPFLDEKTRKAMGEQSVALAKAVDYQSAGTVEFIVDRNRNFYFLEMNTRLQVEHPVTELITGIDLVEQMIRVAAGEPLPFAQEDIRLDGWAIESRLYAEDPYRNFLPSIGRLTRYRPPAEGRTGNVVVRNDTGVFEGAEISMYYDPMIAKLCTWAPTRLEAIDAMGRALDGFVVDGIEHNVPFLSALMKHPRWREGRLSTGFIAEEYPDGFAPMKPEQSEDAVLAAIALSASLIEANRRERFADRLRAASGALREHWVIKIGDKYVAARLLDGLVTIPFDMDIAIEGENKSVVTDWRPGDPVWSGKVGGLDITAQLRPVLNGLRIDWQGLSVLAKVFSPRHAELDRLMPVKLPPDTSKLLLCPMPGLVVAIAVAEGQEVKAGETLAIVEAMKMENVLRADRDLVVSKINAAAGESLAVDAVIMEFA